MERIVGLQYYFAPEIDGESGRDEFRIQGQLLALTGLPADGDSDQLSDLQVFPPLVQIIAHRDDPTQSGFECDGKGNMWQIGWNGVGQSLRFVPMSPL